MSKMIPAEPGWRMVTTAERGYDDPYVVTQPIVGWLLKDEYNMHARAIPVLTNTEGPLPGERVYYQAPDGRLYHAENGNCCGRDLLGLHRQVLIDEPAEDEELDRPRRRRVP
jgi:hypothetical protein